MAAPTRPRRVDAHRRSKSAFSARTASSAAGLPIAVGAGRASQLRADGNLAVAVVLRRRGGREGAFHEAVNLAAVWRLPVIFFCENNGYTVKFSPVATQHAAPLEKRAAGYGIDHVSVDGNDAVATAAVMAERIAAVRAGGGPVLVEATTYRWHGHYEGDPERYRTPEEVQSVGGARRSSCTLPGCGRPAPPRQPLPRSPRESAASSTRASTPRAGCRPRPGNPDRVRHAAAADRFRAGASPWTTRRCFA